MSSASFHDIVRLVHELTRRIKISDPSQVLINDLPVTSFIIEPFASYIEMMSLYYDSLKGNDCP